MEDRWSWTGLTMTTPPTPPPPAPPFSCCQDLQVHLTHQMWMRPGFSTELCLCLSVSVCLSVSLSVSVCLSVSLSLSLSLSLLSCCCCSVLDRASSTAVDRAVVAVLLQGKTISQRNEMQLLQTDKQLASDPENTEVLQYRQQVIIIIDNFCIALFSGVPKLTALYIFQHFLSFTNTIHIIMTTNIV